MIWGVVVVVTAVVTAIVVSDTVVVRRGVVVVVALVDVVTAEYTAFSFLAIQLQAPVAHSTVMQAATAPIARPVFLFFGIINSSVFVVVVGFTVQPTIPQSGGICL